MLALGLTATSFGKALAAPWRLLTSNEGNFSVLMPGKPAFQVDSQKSFVGDIATNLYNLQSKNGQYSASYSDLPGIAVDLGGEGTILGKAKKGLLKHDGGEEQSFTDSSVAGFPAKVLSYSLPAQGKTGKAKFILVHKRLYVLSATQSAAGNPGNIDKFLESFQLLSVPAK
jgi:hypothetical protein